MAGKESHSTTLALRWLERRVIGPVTIKTAAKRFKVHETTLWRALGRMNHQRKAK